MSKSEKRLEWVKLIWCPVNSGNWFWALLITLLLVTNRFKIHIIYACDSEW